MNSARPSPRGGDPLRVAVLPLGEVGEQHRAERTRRDVVGGPGSGGEDHREDRDGDERGTSACGDERRISACGRQWMVARVLGALAGRHAFLPGRTAHAAHTTGVTAA